MCLCRENHWCRTFQETQNGKYPPSEHAPGCDEYTQETFAVVEYDGSRCVMECAEAEALLRESTEQYLVTPVLLTRDQFESIPEFSGF